jgi:hypothetical protein|tara:strand:- start:772 stop:1611 length:840 start_codon:yes stop_codon:yes gene_type:complete
MSFIFGGGGGASDQTTGSSVVTQREAPGVEARKLSLYDQAAKLAASPVNLPTIQVAGLSPAEQQAIAAARQGGVGAGTVTSGIQAIQAGLQAPDIQQFFNPFQSYVTDEIARRGQMQMNQVAAQAVGSGAFGGGREGVQRAELQRGILSQIGQAQAQGFQTALGAAQRQRATQLAGGMNLASVGAQQQAMSMADIQAQLRAGALERGVGQAQLDAQRQTALQRAYEPFQRIEFLKGIMTNLPTTQSTITASTAPGANPLGQALGAGLGAYSAYNMFQPR